MRESQIAQLCEPGIRSAVFGVAKAAAQVRLIGQDGTVHGRHVLHLDCDLPMTIYTTVLHFRGIPRCCVTGFAIPADLRMRGNAAQHLSALRIQWTWVI
jgi:hypothetical protein